MGTIYYIITKVFSYQKNKIGLASFVKFVRMFGSQGTCKENECIQE